MRKFLACILTVAMLAACGVNTVFAAFTIEKDAQTAMEKNQSEVLAAVENAEITNDFTQDDLESIIVHACKYSVDKSYGASLEVVNFSLTPATDSKAGSVKANVVLSQEDGEVVFLVKKDIPKLSGASDSTDKVTVDEVKATVTAALEKLKISNTTAKDDILEAAEYAAPSGVSISVDKFDLTVAQSGGTGTLEATITVKLADGESGSFKYSKTFSNGTAQEESKLKKEIAAAKSAISAAMWDFEVSNDTTKEEILKMANNALPSGSTVTVSLNSSDISITKASTTIEGTLSATLTLNCGGIEERHSVAKTIPKVVNAESTKIDADRSAVSKAVSAITYTNKTTKEDMFEAAQKAVKNGSKLAWKGEVKKVKATFEAEGLITGDLSITLGGETRELGFRERIPKLTSKMPNKTISVTEDEWKVLRLTNKERAKQGLYLLTMAGPLQDACNIREKEALESFSHTRPDGTKFSTAISQSFKHNIVGENLHHCTPGHENPERAVTDWMNSPAHRENILRDSFDYIGIGINDTNAVQIFAGVENPIETVTSSTGSMSFEDEEAMIKEYLICRTSGGTETYIPLDTDYMTKTDGGYTLKIRSTNPIVVTVGNSTTEVKEEKVSFNDVKDSDYFAAPVKWAVEKGITTGTSNTTFSPAETCTRAQILTFLWRAVGSPKSSKANPFGDVKASDYYYDAAVWASEKGMVSGNTFAGDTPCTRSSTVVYMWKNAGSPKIEIPSKFSDVPLSSEYAPAVAWALANSVTSGTSETEFSPDTICDRGQIVTFLNRALS